MKYPKTLDVGQEIYTIRFVNKFKEKDTVGECDPEKCEIRILRGMSRRETFSTFLHELLHALEFEHELKISHKLVYKLEIALFELIMDNFT